MRKADWTPGWEDEVHRAIETLGSAVTVLVECARLCSGRLGLGDGGWSLDELTLMGELARHLMASPAPPIVLLVRPDWDEIERLIGTWIEQGKARDRVRSRVREKYRDEVVELDLDDLRARHERAEASWWPTSWWRRRPVRRSLRTVARDGKPPARQGIGRALDLAIALREKQRKLDAAGEEARVLLGRYWNRGEAQWDAIARVRDWARALRDLAVRASGGDFERAGLLREKWAQAATEGKDLLRRDGSIGREFVAHGEAFDAFNDARRQAIDLLDLDADRAWGGDGAPDVLGRVRSSTTAWKAGARQLRHWCAWRRARADAIRSNLAPLVEAYEQGVFTSSRLGATFERSYTEWWLAAVTDREPVLSQFFSPEHDRKIGQFRQVDDRYMQLTRLLIEARLAKRVPATSAGGPPNSEMGILRREIGKRRRHMPVRQLFHRIPNLLPRLKPCLLMSPVSVAQFLDATYPPFDVVVFDEASQIPVWDAVGAIARGQRAVIAGDPKQLPPTSFFQRLEDDDEEGHEEDVEDLESVLDDCIAAQIPWLPLEWHYRSRHESLITFSNYHYYGNRLLTFPSPALEGLGVSWRHVPHGVYDKGKSRTNRAEAEAVVQEILRRLRDARLSDYSIGVVTFSLAQQALVEDLLDAARAKDPELDPYFAEDRDEAVFVKNLENVQGDERDVILFSICYGPDALGRVSMNFGPMNREGGERRLNVAITRARREVLVFSTLKADQIDLSRTRARGVRDLKVFLDYAERGPAAIAEATQRGLDADFDSPFEEAVYDALVQRGWTVHKQVGCARYRIDLAVVDPEAPGRYLLGVECDGANYHRAKTARDRDKLREGVLRDLGWKLHRVWSTDWWTDPEREIRKVDEALERARHAAESNAAPVQILEPSNEPPATERGLFASGIDTANAESEPQPVPADLEIYRPIECLSAGSQADFYDGRAVSAIRDRLIEVVQREGPISLKLAARRVAAAWGFERVRSRAVKRIRRLVPKAEVYLQMTDAGEFLWPTGLDPESYGSFRVPDSDGNGAREADDLPLEEIGNAVVYLLERFMSAPLEELTRETARRFGFMRVGCVVDERIRRGIERLVARGVARRDGELIALSR